MRSRSYIDSHGFVDEVLADDSCQPIVICNLFVLSAWCNHMASKLVLHSCHIIDLSSDKAMYGWLPWECSVCKLLVS